MAEEVPPNLRLVGPKDPATMETWPAIVIVGTPVDGFQFVGPFPDEATAIEYGDQFARQEDWWAVELAKPDKTFRMPDDSSEPE